MSPELLPRALALVYRNYKGIVARRVIEPLSLSFVRNPHHPGVQWILKCFDLDRGEVRDYALADCNFQLQGWIKAADQPQPLQAGTYFIAFSGTYLGTPKMFTDIAEWHPDDQFGYGTWYRGGEQFSEVLAYCGPLLMPALPEDL